MIEDLLKINSLHTYFYLSEGTAKAVEGVNLTIAPSETVALVGESGSGKTLSALSIIRLIPNPGKIVQGEILFNENGKYADLLKISEEEIRKIRGAKISMVFQEPFTSLNPVFTVGYQIGESVTLHLGLREKGALEKIKNSLSLVGIKDVNRVIKSYPHELSGGMRQRVLIAMALVSNPRLLIADEPTTALDVTIQAQILDLIADIKSKLKLSMLIITHDLGIVYKISDMVNIMYAGRIVEKASKLELFKKPLHPYTKGLLSSIPTMENIKKRLDVIKGTVPDPLDFPAACKFHPRCPYVMEICRIKEPPDTEINNNRIVRCWLYEKH